MNYSITATCVCSVISGWLSVVTGSLPLPLALSIANISPSALIILKCARTWRVQIKMQHCCGNHSLERSKPLLKDFVLYAGASVKGISADKTVTIFMVITAKEKTGAGPKHKPQKKEEHNWSSLLLLKAYKRFWWQLQCCENVFPPSWVQKAVLMISFIKGIKAMQTY